MTDDKQPTPEQRAREWEAWQIMDDLQTGQTLGANDRFVRVQEYDAFVKRLRDEEETHAELQAAVKYERSRAKAWQERAEVAEAAADQSNYRNTVAALNVIGKERDQLRSEVERLNGELLLTGRDPSLVTYGEMMAERDKLQVELADWQKKHDTLTRTPCEFRDECMSRREKLDLAVEGLKFYASALDIKTENNFGEPNREAHHMPVKLGTFARETLSKIGGGE